jgi:hypothetical protein
MTLRITSLALATAIAALAVTSLADSASAQRDRIDVRYILDEAEIPSFQRVLQPSQNLPTSRPDRLEDTKSIIGLRSIVTAERRVRRRLRLLGTSDMGGGAMRGMRGGGRMNGGMGRRR